MEKQYYHIGLYQNMDSPSYSEPYGGWEWITGENVDYLNWVGTEPDSDPNSNWGEIVFASSGVGWNDMNDTDSVVYKPQVKHWRKTGGQDTRDEFSNFLR